MTTKQTKEKLVANITTKINNFIQSEIASFTDEDTKWKQHYDSVMENLKYEMEQVKAVIADYKEDNFTVNVIETEGYLRGITTMYNQFKDWEKYVEDK